jgi:GNAT superfamily N-acetyltransferase
MAPFDIRQARVEDAAAACEVLRRSITELCAADHHNDPAWLAGWLANKTPENVAAWITDPGNVVYVAVDSGRIAGVAAMNKTGRISLNYVSPDARCRGVSKALLAALEAKAADLGLTRCTLESTKTALGFYRAAGYREQQGCAAPACLPAEAESCRPMVNDII